MKIIIIIIIIIIIAHWWNDIGVGKPKYWWKNLSR